MSTNGLQGNFNVSLMLDGEEIGILTQEIGMLYFIEDIFSYSITGKLTFNDRQGILEFGPLTGHEKIVIIYGIDQIFTLEFNIYKINRIIPTWSEAHGKDNFIEILFVDDWFYNLIGKQYSISWFEEMGSDIVKHISEHMIQQTEFDKWEDTNEEFEYFYLPYWTPKQGIDWIIKRCSGVESGKSGYLFYNSIVEGEIKANFITLEKLLSEPGLFSTADNPLYYFTTDYGFDWNRILSYNLSGIDNLSRFKLKGGHRKGYDSHQKKFIDVDFNYSDSIGEYTLLGKKSLFEDISEPDTQHILSGEVLEEAIENIYYDDWIKRYCMQQVLSIIVQGHQERLIGSLIDVEWPSMHKDEMYNKNFGGKYLVKSITHQFGSGSPWYQQKMVLIKNAYEDSDNTKLLKSVNMNLGE